MALPEPQKKYLRSLGHALKPVVTIGDAGVSDAVLREFDTSIAHHELIKVKIRASDRDTRNAAIEQLCKQGKAELVTRIGNVALVFRRNSDAPKIVLPGQPKRRPPGTHS